MDYLLLLIFFLLLVPVILLYTKNTLFTRFIMDTEMKRNMKTLIKKFFKDEKLDMYDPWEFSRVEQMDADKNVILVEVWARRNDVNQDKVEDEWNVESKMFTVIMKRNSGGSFDLVSITEKHSIDSGMIIPENSSNLLTYSWGIPNMVREYLGSLRSAFETVQWADIPECEIGGAETSLICKNPQVVDIGGKESEIMKFPKHKVLEDPESKKFECQIMLPKEGEFIMPNGILGMECHERKDQNNTHWIAEDEMKLDDYSKFEQLDTSLGYKFGEN